jgi:hypothetical protein
MRNAQDLSSQAMPRMHTLIQKNEKNAKGEK